MNTSQWLELCQLAEKLCPTVLLDLAHFTESDAIGVLNMLRRKALEASQ